MEDIMDKILLKEYKNKLALLTEKEKKIRATYLRDLSLGKILGPVTGYASIDKSWLKYYNDASFTALLEFQKKKPVSMRCSLIMQEKILIL